MSKHTQLRIDSSALVHNVQQVKQHAPGKKIIAMVKANAYGCGLSIVIPTIAEHVDAFGVSCIEEARLLRELDLEHDCILFQGVGDKDEYKLAQESNLSCVIHTQSQVDWLIKTKLSSLSVWIKVNTGLNRLGFDINEVEPIFNILRQCAWVNKIGIMTHLSRADEPKNEYNTLQLKLFDQVLPNYPMLDRSIGNSAAILSHMPLNANFVRPGIMLYGVSPFAEQNGVDLGLQPVMSLHSKITSIRHYPTGACVGYGATWCSQRPSTIGLIPVGYGDGYPRHIAPNTPVAIGKYLVPIVGRVSMDMMTIDLTDFPEVHLGDAVELWGVTLPIEVIARSAGTIAYEILCQMTNRARIGLQSLI